LSVGGAFLVTDYPGTPGSIIRISFALPGGTKIDCPGRVAWVNGTASKTRVGFGIKFSMLPKHAIDALATFIKSIG